MCVPRSKAAGCWGKGRRSRGCRAAEIQFAQDLCCEGPRAALKLCKLARGFCEWWAAEAVQDLHGTEGGEGAGQEGCAGKAGAALSCLGAMRGALRMWLHWSGCAPCRWMCCASRHLGFLLLFAKWLTCLVHLAFRTVFRAASIPVPINLGEQCGK